MLFMSVKLDVTRLSGWLNADAPCRVAPRHVEGEPGVDVARAHAVLAVWRCSQHARRNLLDTGHGTRAGMRT